MPSIVLLTLQHRARGWATAGAPVPTGPSLCLRCRTGAGLASLSWTHAVAVMDVLRTDATCGVVCITQVEQSSWTCSADSNGSHTAAWCNTSPWCVGDCMSTSRSRVGSQELAEDAAGSAANPDAHVRFQMIYRWLHVCCRSSTRLRAGSQDLAEDVARPANPEVHIG